LKLLLFKRRKKKCNLIYKPTKLFTYLLFTSDNLRLKDIQKNRELEECTFKPHLNDHLKPGTNHQNRIDKIYESGKQLILSRKQVKDKNELELERQQAECRFAPKVDQ